MARPDQSAGRQAQEQTTCVLFIYVKNKHCVPFLYVTLGAVARVNQVIYIFIA